jgi:hypothetical protein
MQIQNQEKKIWLLDTAVVLGRKFQAIQLCGSGSGRIGIILADQDCIQVLLIRIHNHFNQMYS